jgi:hypothetical protein
MDYFLNGPWGEFPESPGCGLWSHSSPCPCPVNYGLFALLFLAEEELIKMTDIYKK